MAKFYRQNLIDFIKQHEGLRLDAYRCPAGKWTIGYGHTSTARQGQTITKNEAEVLLLRDLILAGEAVDKLISVPLYKHQRDALTSFVFNLGADRLRNSTLRQKLNKGDYDGAADELPRWVFARDPETKRMTKLPGLIKRRAQERAIFLGEDYEESTTDSSCVA